MFTMNCFHDGAAMDLYHLKTFFTLGKIQNFTKTAEYLCVTQSAVSHAVKKLEASIETPLIDRKGKPFMLTQAGKTLYRSCEKIFYEIEKAGQDMSNFKETLNFSIRVGSTVEFGTTILMNHIRDFLHTYPDIHLDFIFSHHLIDHLIQDQVDMIIDCKPHLHQNIEKIHLFREQYITIASPEFIKTKHITSLDDLERVKILSMDKDLEWWHNFITAIPADKQGCLKNVMQINHVRGLINGAVAGLGIGFVPRYTVITELENNILVDPFPHIKPMADEFHIYIKKECLAFQKNQLLLDYLTKLKPSEFGAD